MVSLFPDINAADVESAAVHVKRRIQSSDGKPFVPLSFEFRDSPAVVAELSAAGVDFVAGPTDMKLESGFSVNGKAVWITYCWNKEIVPGKPPGLWRDLRAALAWAGDYLFFLQPFFKDTPRLRERVEVRISRPFVWLMNRCPGFRSPKGRATARKVIQAAERAISAAWTFKRYIRRINPDVLLVSPLLSHSGMQWEYLRAAKALRVPTGYCVASWDNLTTKGALRGEPDYTLVWNGIQKREREAVELHGSPGTRLRRQVDRCAQAVRHHRVGRGRGPDPTLS
jgi:hypothetical protein